ncbi:MAG: hypothetical protein JNL80_16260 [Phycisphaerae bacterium]|nr:hypothetical protein [Phycisphaerae bacterium]
MSGGMAAADTWYVKIGGSDLNDGDDWSVAFATIQTAIDSASDNDMIKVAEGTYLPTQASGSGPETKTFRLENGKLVLLLGGFPTNATANTIQNPDLYPTVLSGDLANDDPPAGSGDNSENAYHVVSLIGTTNAAKVDGFIIERGNADNLSVDGGDGGGVYIARDGSGSYCSGVIQNCEIRSCYAHQGGGLVVNGDLGGPRSEPSIRTIFVHDNDASRGAAGLEFRESAPEVADCVIVDNTGQSDGVGVRMTEPPLPETGEQLARLLNCTVAFNRCTGSNAVGGVTLYGGSSGDDQLLIENCILSGNESWDGDDGFYEQLWVASDNGWDPVQMNYSNVSGTYSGPSLGTGNINDADPGFVSTEPNDPSSGDFRLSPSSPCINAGHPDDSRLPADLYDADYDNVTTSEELPDRDRLPRREQCRVDMGAFEFRIACPWDLDADGNVGAPDLAILLGLWGSCAEPCIADFDCSGSVGSPDLAILLGAWGACNPAPFAGGGESSAMAFEGAATSPAELAALLGFSSIEEFAFWLGECDPAVREAILSGLMGGGW